MAFSVFTPHLFVKSTVFPAKETIALNPILKLI